ncbi:MAG: tyrosine recombinase XerC [Pontixanthobacter sp.]
MTGHDLVADWSKHLAKARRRSPHTVRAYCAAANRLVVSSAISDWNDLATIEPATIRAQLAERRREGLGNASVARELSAIRALIAFARERCGLTQLAPPRLRGPRTPKGLPRPVTPDDAANLAETVGDVAAESWIGLRDRAVLLLLYGAGLRIAEALTLTGAVLPLDESVTVLGKGGKQRVVPILPIIVEAIDAYADACPWPIVKDGPLFIGAKGGPLRQNMVQKAVAKARIALGLPATATPHALRHSFATHLLGAGADLRSLQELLGHASLGSTQIYTKVDTATMLDTYRNAHPRASSDGD